MNSQDLFSIKDEIIVLTGSEGQLGQTYLECIIDKGARVLALDKRISPSHKLYKGKKEVKLLECDVTKKSDLNEALEIVKETFGSPTVLINNAALDSPPSSDDISNCRFEDFSESVWEKVIEVNLKGVFLCSQVFGTEMSINNKGSIINISSIYGLVSPDQSFYQYRRDRGEDFFKPIAYSVSKSGIINMTKYLATYWADKNVRVNTLTLAGVGNDQDKEFLELYNRRIPIGRMATPQDYLGAIIFLSSESSSYMTGSNIIVDGGYTAI